MIKIPIALILLISSFNCFTKDEQAPAMMGDEFKKMIKKREVTQSQKEKNHYKKEFDRFSSWLYKEITRQHEALNYGVEEKNDKGSKPLTYLDAALYYRNNAFAINHELLNGEYTAESVKRVVDFWNKKGVYNPEFWVDMCKTVGTKEIVSNRDEIEKQKQRGLPLNYISTLEEYPIWRCKFENGKSEIIYNF
jgi:hypothetical protein